MLREIKHVRQIEGEGYRRWFSDNYFDLFVWLDNNKIAGFQLCYAKHAYALTWKKDSGFSHNSIDDGEADPTANRTPILVADGLFPRNDVSLKFKKASANMDKEIADFVYNTLLMYSDEQCYG